LRGVGLPPAPADCESRREAAVIDVLRHGERQPHAPPRVLGISGRA